MITGPLIHADILHALAGAGHKARVLVSDGFFAASTTVGPHATVVRLGLEPGVPTVTRVVQLIQQVVAIEAWAHMEAPADVDVAAQDEVAALLGDIPRERLSRAELYGLARSDDLALAVITGDTRRFANVVLTLGVWPPKG